MSKVVEYENQLKDAAKLTSGHSARGPMMMRCHRKQQALEGLSTSLNNLSLNTSGLSRSLNGSLSTGRAPCAGAGGRSQSLGPTGFMYPGGGGGRNTQRITPKKSKDSSDRHIPNRSSSQYDLASMIVRKKECGDDAELSPGQKEHRDNMWQNLTGTEASSRILSYQQKNAPQGQSNSLRTLYSTQKSKPAKKAARHIPAQPERILDAPDFLDDYYLNLIDWSVNNLVAVALAGRLYIWDANDSTINELLEMDSPNEYLSSVSWATTSNFLAVGTSDCKVQVWDAGSQKLLRTMTGHSSRVGSLSWNAHVVSSGSRSGAIHHHDVRVARHHVGTLTHHTQEVCGLRWSPDGRFLASGGNDNVLNIWPSNLMGDSIAPLHTCTDHQAAVKALAWCPWQPSLLASGGGTADRCIKFWNGSTGDCINSVDTGSQVCALLWNAEYKELISSHGFADNQLTIWKYPVMTKIHELKGHTCRVLHMCMSPDGSTVMSGAADETLRMWKCFSPDPAKSKKVDSRPASVMMRQSIR